MLTAGETAVAGLQLQESCWDWHSCDTTPLTKGVTNGGAVTLGNVNIDGVRMNSDMCHHHSDPPPSYPHQQLSHYDSTQVITPMIQSHDDMNLSSGV